MRQSSDNKIIPMTSVDSGKLREVRPDVAYYTNQVVNLIMIGRPDSSWVLIDAGMPKSGEEIFKVARQRYGNGNPPSAIIITHGHFDHVGSIVDLLTEWDVPVYAHPLEFPFPYRPTGLSLSLILQLKAASWLNCHFYTPLNLSISAKYCKVYLPMAAFLNCPTGNGYMYPVIRLDK
jgi:hypothetical protein